jgi:hypothetical protein
MKVVTAINQTTNFGFNLLRLSCAINKLDLVVLLQKGPFTSNRLKDQLLKEYLENTDANEIIFFTDGNDAVFLADETEILNKYYNAETEVLFSAEVVCWPDNNLSDQYPSTLTPYRFLNSGGFIGKAGTLKALLDDREFDLENFKQSNQYLWTKRYFKYRDVISLDTNCDIFCTFCPVLTTADLPDKVGNQHFSYLKDWFRSNFEISDQRIKNKITQSMPCHAHFNGFSKALMSSDIVNLLYERLSVEHTAVFYIKQD